MKNAIAVADCFPLFDSLYTPKLITTVNDSAVMVVKVKGDEVPWHTHAHEDELFWVMEGEIIIHMRDKSVPVRAGEMYKVPKGVEHKITAENLAHLLLIESTTFQHTGTSESAITKTSFEPLFADLQEGEAQS